MMNALQRKENDLAQAKAAGLVIDKLIRKSATIKKVETDLVYQQGSHLPALSLRVYDLHKLRGKRLHRQLHAKGFTPILLGEDHFVVSKEVPAEGQRQLVQVTVYEHQLVCKCFVGTVVQVKPKVVAAPVVLEQPKGS